MDVGSMGTISRIGTIAFLFAFFGLSVLAAQSGRKPEKPTKPTPPTTTGTTTTPSSGSSDSSTTTNSNEPSRPAPAKIPILVGDDGLSKSDRYAKAMLDYFVDRLNDTRTTSPLYIGVIKKNQAISRAKTETSGWVVFVEIRVDRFGSSGINYSQPDMTFNYIVYKAGSDQEVAKGKVRMQNLNNTGRGPLGIPQPVPTVNGGKTTPEETGRSAADQVMYAIQSNTRSPR